MIDLVTRYFPSSIRMTYPQGGYLLWIVLPDTIDTTQLNLRLADYSFSIAAGTLFTASEKFKHCLRINYAQAMTSEIEKAIATIGNVIQNMLDESNHSE
jgi:DNA-binding transcriptional MocR family regulator